jgi:MYXO-CTERM domain-containing protein
MPAQTSWTVTTTLMDMTRYYWRVWANDSQADSEVVSTWFDVDTSIVPTDASTDTVGDVPTDTWTPPLPSDESGCGCRTIPPAGDALPWTALGLVLASLGLIVTRRRDR